MSTYNVSQLKALIAEVPDDYPVILRLRTEAGVFIQAEMVTELEQNADEQMILIGHVS